eukprot:GHRR01008363.1.p1 GENE.GHRR01008363.1~~GHRR01008363.1.p1  ORF type:complete len:351 (+),score=93.67 GHRR01008363.1:982-2034(+)
MRPPRPPYTRIQLFLLLSAVCGTTLLLVLVYELVVPHHTQFATTAKWRKASQTSAASTTVADAANKPVQLTSMLGIQNATASCNDTPVCQLPVSWMLQRPYLHPIYKLNTSITTNTTTTTSSSSNQESSNNIRQSSSHLTGATDPAVALSRQQLQAYLASAEFTAYKLQLSENPAARLQQKHEQYLLPTHAPSRGILIVAGGRKLLTHLVVQLQVLRHVLHCDLPVEVAWQGATEMDNRTLAELQRRYAPLTGFDIQARPYPAHHRRVKLKRWVGKVAALLFCSFAEVLLLDSDNLPLVNPAQHFKDPLYIQEGNLFWPDFWSDWVRAGVWSWLGLNKTVVQVCLHAEKR